MSTTDLAEPTADRLILIRSHEAGARDGVERPHPGCRLQCRLEGAGRAPAPGCLRSGETAAPTGSAIRSTRHLATSPHAA